jgi:hypothetical protein
VREEPKQRETLERQREAFERVVANIASSVEQEMANEKLNDDELAGLEGAKDILEMSVRWFREMAPPPDAEAAEEYFYRLEWAISTAYYIGATCEENPNWKRIQAETARRRTSPASEKRAEPRRKRLEIMEPLVVDAYFAEKPKRKTAYSIAKHILADVRKELKARGMATVGFDAVHDDIQDIMKDSLLLPF